MRRHERGRLGREHGHGTLTAMVCIGWRCISLTLFRLTLLLFLTLTLLAFAAQTGIPACASRACYRSIDVDTQHLEREVTRQSTLANVMGATLHIFFKQP